MVQARKPLRLHIACLVASLVLVLAGTGFAQTTTTVQVQPNTLTAVGNSEVRVRPDLAVVSLGVQTEATTAAQAREENAMTVGKIIGALRSQGIKDSQIETSTFQIYPVRRSATPNQTGEPPIVGYNVTNIVSVRTENLDLAPRIIDASVQAGANTVESVSFQLKDDTAARQNALSQAAADAVRNARTMAQALGVKLVRVYQVQQGAQVIPQPYAMRSLAMQSATPTPIFPGQVTVDASITLTYIID